jgi:hypothetical protein
VLFGDGWLITNGGAKLRWGRCRALLAISLLAGKTH